MCVTGGRHAGQSVRAAGCGTEAQLPSGCAPHPGRGQLGRLLCRGGSAAADARRADCAAAPELEELPFQRLSQTGAWELSPHFIVGLALRNSSSN